MPPALSPEQALRRLQATLEEQGCHLTDEELRTAMARVGAPEQYDEASMLKLVEEGLHCWARKDQTAAVTTALGMNQLGLEKDFEELKVKFNEMLGILDEVMQTSGISKDSNPRKKVEEMRGSLEKKVTEKQKNVASDVKHEWEGLTYAQAFQDPQQLMFWRHFFSSDFSIASRSGGMGFDRSIACNMYPLENSGTYQLGTGEHLPIFPLFFFLQLEHFELAN